MNHSMCPDLTGFGIDTFPVLIKDRPFVVLETADDWIQECLPAGSYRRTERHYFVQGNFTSADWGGFINGVACVEKPVSGTYQTRTDAKSIPLPQLLEKFVKGVADHTLRNIVREHSVALAASELFSIRRRLLKGDLSEGIPATILALGEFYLQQAPDDLEVIAYLNHVCQSCGIDRSFRLDTEYLIEWMLDNHVTDTAWMNLPAYMAKNGRIAVYVDKIGLTALVGNTGTGMCVRQSFSNQTEVIRFLHEEGFLKPVSDAQQELLVLKAAESEIPAQLKGVDPEVAKPSTESLVPSSFSLRNKRTFLSRLRRQLVDQNTEVFRRLYLETLWDVLAVIPRQKECDFTEWTAALRSVLEAIPADPRQMPEKMIERGWVKEVPSTLTNLTDKGHLLFSTLQTADILKALRVLTYPRVIAETLMSGLEVQGGWWRRGYQLQQRQGGYEWIDRGGRAISHMLYSIEEADNWLWLRVVRNALSVIRPDRELDDHYELWMRTESGSYPIPMDPRSEVTCDKWVAECSDQLLIDTVNYLCLSRPNLRRVPEPRIGRGMDWGPLGFESVSATVDEASCQLVYQACMDLAVLLDVPAEAISFDGVLALRIRYQSGLVMAELCSKQDANGVQISQEGGFAFAWGCAFYRRLAESNSDIGFPLLENSSPAFQNLLDTILYSSKVPQLPPAFHSWSSKVRVQTVLAGWDYADLPLCPPSFDSHQLWCDAQSAAFYESHPHRPFRPFIGQAALLARSGRNSELLKGERLFALAFEAYVDSIAVESGIQNVWLVHSADNASRLQRELYPAGEELRAIAVAFDECMSELWKS